MLLQHQHPLALVLGPTIGGDTGDMTAAPVESETSAQALRERGNKRRDRVR